MGEDRVRTSLHREHLPQGPMTPEHWCIIEMFTEEGSTACNDEGREDGVRAHTPRDDGVEVAVVPSMR